MRAWPFLIAASKSMDYRTVVAPDFVCQAGPEAIDSFSTSVPTDYVPFDQVLRCEWRPPGRTKTYEVAYRLVEATAAHLGEGDTTPLKDKFKREIRLIEGLVFEGHFGEVTHAELDDAHERILAPFREFWRAEGRWNTAASTPLQESNRAENASANAESYESARPRGEPRPMPVKNGSLKEAGTREKVTSILFAGDERTMVVRTGMQNIIICHTYTRDALDRRKDIKGSLSPHLLAVNAHRPSQFATVINNDVLKTGARAHGLAIFTLGDYMGGAPTIALKYMPAGSSPLKQVTFDHNGALVVVDGSNRATTWATASRSSWPWSKPEADDPNWPYGEAESGVLTDDVTALVCAAYDGGNLFVVGDADGGLRFYQDRLAYDRGLERSVVHSSAVRLLAVSPDGEYYASSDGRDICLVETRTGKALTRLSDPARGVVSLAIRLKGGSFYARDGEYQMFVGYDDARVRVFDVPTLESEVLPLLPPSSLQAMDVTEDGRFIVTVLGDGTLNVWHTRQR